MGGREGEQGGEEEGGGRTIFGGMRWVGQGSWEGVPAWLGGRQGWCAWRASLCSVYRQATCTRMIPPSPFPLLSFLIYGETWAEATQGLKHMGSALCVWRGSGVCVLHQWSGERVAWQHCFRLAWQLTLALFYHN